MLIYVVWETNMSKSAHILNSISNVLIIVCTCIFLVFAIKKYCKKYNKTLNYIELRNDYKNCIIMGKSNHDDYILLLHNPFLHMDDSTGVKNVDYKVHVTDYIYFNKFIGDTIK